MKTATSIKLDKEVKEEATKLAKELGLNLSIIINATLKKFVNERRVVFSAHPELNAKTQREFLERRQQWVYATSSRAYLLVQKRYFELHVHIGR